MNELKIFEFGHQSVETITLNDEVLFNPYDVGKCLDLKESSVTQYISRMDGLERTDLKSILGNDSINLKFIENSQRYWLKESGVYELIFNSRKPEAKEFRKWITNDVLPSIRKTGMYVENKQNRLIENLTTITEQLLGIRREELAILQAETPNKKLSNLMVDCSRHGLGAMKDLYKELFYIFTCETGIDIQALAGMQNLSRRDYLKQNPQICETVYKFAYDHFNRDDRQVYLVSIDPNQKDLLDFR